MEDDLSNFHHEDDILNRQLRQTDCSRVVVSVDREWLGEDSWGNVARWMPRHFR